MSNIGWEPWEPSGHSFKAIRLERAGVLARLTFDNPRTLNSLTRQAVAEIPEATHAVDLDGDIRALILTGSGRGFSSGADIKDFLAARLEGPTGTGLPDRAGRELPLLGDVQTPVIAAVNGAAAGAGFILALLADFRIASTDAFFVESHVARGLTPSVSAWLLPNIVGLTRAAEIVMLGRRVGAQEALTIGLVNQVVERDQLESAAVELGHEIAALPRFAVLTAKGAMRRGLERSLDEVREWGGAMEALSHASTDEMSEGVQGFGPEGRHPPKRDSNRRAMR